MAYCYTCGYENQDGARFCYSCGGPAAVALPQPPAPSVPTESTPKTAIAGLIIGAIGLLEATIAHLPQYSGGIIAIICIVISVILCLRSLSISRNTKVALAGVVCNGLAIWMVVAGYSLAAINNAGDSGGNSGGGSSHRSFQGDGVHIVGAEISPGRYGSVGSYDPALGNCEFSRLSEYGDVLQSGQAGSNHRVIVAIQPSDGAFYTFNCGRWTALRD